MCDERRQIRLCLNSFLPNKILDHTIKITYHFVHGTHQEWLCNDSHEHMYIASSLFLHQRHQGIWYPVFPSLPQGGHACQNGTTDWKPMSHILHNVEATFASVFLSKICSPWHARTIVDLLNTYLGNYISRSLLQYDKCNICYNYFTDYRGLCFCLAADGARDGVRNCGNSYINHLHLFFCYRGSFCYGFSGVVQRTEAPFLLRLFWCCWSDGRSFSFNRS